MYSTKIFLLYFSKKKIDEFLIERKNPLTVPPDFSNLPKPRNSKDENKMNFSLKIESNIPIGPECMGKLIASILNDSKGWKNVVEKDFN